MSLLRFFSIGAVISLMTMLLSACITDQTCSNSPHIRNDALQDDVLAQVGYSRANPIPLDTVTTYGVWDISVNRAVQIAGKVYVNLAAEYVGEESSSNVDDLHFCLTGSSHLLYVDVDDDDGPSPVFGEGYGEDQIRDGWIAFDAPEDESDLILAVRHDSTVFYSDADFRYFELEPGVSTDLDLSAATTATEVGTTLAEPVPVGAAAVTSTFSLEIVEALTGDAAFGRMKAAKSWNPDPAEGMEFFLFKVRAQNISSSSSPSSISGSQFSADGFLDTLATLIAESAVVTGGTRRDSAMYSFSLELPGDRLEATLFPGASFEGWVLLEVPIGTVPLVVYDPALGAGLTHNPDRRYFILDSDAQAGGEPAASTAVATTDEDASADEVASDDEETSEEEASETIELSGTGDSSERIELDEGVWTVEFSVAENLACDSDSCNDAPIFVRINSSQGRSNILVSETASTLAVSKTIRLSESAPDLSPGQQRVSVRAEGDWSISFSKQ